MKRSASSGSRIPDVPLSVRDAALTARGHATSPEGTLSTPAMVVGIGEHPYRR